MEARRRLVEDVERPARVPLRQLPDSLILWASPPESVVADWPSYIRRGPLRSAPSASP